MIEQYSIDPDQTGRERAVGSGYKLFVHALLAKDIILLIGYLRPKLILHYLLQN